MHYGREIHIGVEKHYGADFYLRTSIGLIKSGLRFAAFTCFGVEADSEDAQNCGCRNDQRKLHNGPSPAQTSGGIRRKAKVSAREPAAYASWLT